MITLIRRLYDKKIDASGLAVFRVLYGIVLFFEVGHLFYFRHLIFDKIPYVEVSEIDYTIPLILWMITIVFLIFGLCTKVTTIINYLFTLVFISTISTYEYHMFYIYIGVNFLLLFTSVSKVGSLDALWIKLKYSNTQITYNPPRTTSVLNYYIFVLLGIGFVYFDSIFQKTASTYWLNGLGMWAPLSVPQSTLLSSSNFVLNSKVISLLLGYIALIFEGIFIFTFYRKAWRLPLLIIGLGLHLGILIVFPIPLFALGVSALYMLMVPVSFWVRLHQKLVLKKPKLTFYYDEECPLCNRTKIILNHLDFFKAIEFKGVQTYGYEDVRLKGISRDELLDNIYSVSDKNMVYSAIDTYKFAFKRIPLLFPIGFLISIPGVSQLANFIYKKVAQNRYVERCTEDNCGFTPALFPENTDDIKLLKTIRLKDLKIYSLTYGLLLLSFFQLNCIYTSLLIENAKDKIGINDSVSEKKLKSISIGFKKISKSFFGITKHAVFVDSHFENYNHIIALQAELENGQKLWLPLNDINGTPDEYNEAFVWAKWAFRVNNPNINQEDLRKGIRDFTAFWAYKNKVDLNTTKFLVKVKKVDIPTKWEKNFLSKQIAKPWIDGGYIKWQNNLCESHIKDIEHL